MLKNYPLAACSLIVGVLSFVQLFGLEKALFAVLLGVYALRGLKGERAGGRKLAYAGIALGALYAVVLVWFLVTRGGGLAGAPQ